MICFSNKYKVVILPINDEKEKHWKTLGEIHKKFGKESVQIGETSMKIDAISSGSLKLMKLSV